MRPMCWFIDINFPSDVSEQSLSNWIVGEAICEVHRYSRRPFHCTVWNYVKSTIRKTSYQYIFEAMKPAYIKLTFHRSKPLVHGDPNNIHSLHYCVLIYSECPKEIKRKVGTCITYIIKHVWVSVGFFGIYWRFFFI